MCLTALLLSGSKKPNTDLSQLEWVGNPDLMKRRKIAVFCSSRCSGKAILAVEARFHSPPNPDNVFMGGFQTDVGKMVLSLLLRNGHNGILFPARSIHKIRLPGHYPYSILEELFAG